MAFKSKSRAALIQWIEQRLASSAPVTEITAQDPKLTVAAAYRIQAELMQRRVRQGDRIVGYKAALTSKAMQQREGIDTPVLGTLLASRGRSEAEPVSLAGFLKGTVEPEVGVVLARDLAGPGVTAQSALAAIAGYVPAIEVGDIRTDFSATALRRTLQHTICCNTFNGAHLFGTALTPPGIDLRREGMVLSCNGRQVASATASEVLGNPLLSVVFMANKLAELGLSLRAGMVLLTGSIVSSIPVQPGDRVRVEFTRLGEIGAAFVA
jgi:2-keto-4-pentenoate hydratase